VNSAVTYKEISNIELYNLGINPNYRNQPIIVDSIEDLKKNPPMIVIGEAQLDTRFRQNNFIKEQELKKRNNYIMALGVYQQLSFDPRSKTTILKPSKFKFKNVYKPYRGQDLSGKTLLVWRQGGIGDLLFISPSLKFLKEKYPSCKILFGCGAQYQSMVKQWSCIDEVIDLPFTADYLFRSDYHALFEGVIERTKQAESDNAYVLFSKWLGLDIPIEKLLPEQTPSGKYVKKTQIVLNTWGIEENNFILVQMRASSPIRTPRPEIWIKIINSLTSNGYKVILTDSEHQSNNIDMFIHKLNDKDKVFNFSKYSTELADTIALTSLAKLVLGVDSSLVHIAESVGVKSFSFFGPFLGHLRLSTYRKAQWVDAKCMCAPCFTHGQNVCKNSRSGYVNCFDNIDIDDVLIKIKELMM